MKLKTFNYATIKKVFLNKNMNYCLKILKSFVGNSLKVPKLSQCFCN